MCGRGAGHLDSKLPKLQQRDPKRLRASSNVEPVVRNLLECMRGSAPELSASLKTWHALAAETGAAHCANDAQALPRPALDSRKRCNEIAQPQIWLAQSCEGFRRQRRKQQSAGIFSMWKTRI
jgi:hypothetical protein